MSVKANPGAVPPSQHGLGEYLELLANIGQDFASSLDISASLDKALARIADNLNAEAASLFLLENDDKDLVCRACFGPTDITGLRIGASDGIVGRSVQENCCQIVRDVRLDPDFAKSVDEESGFTTRSILCAPMSVKDRRVGAIELLNKRSGDRLFSHDDQSALQVLASSAALALINARLTTALIEQEKMRRELELAAEIQRNLLPRRRSVDFPVAGINVPARGVSGDFYDIFSLADGRVCFNVGDVSGKGINAALLMAKTSSLFRCLGKAVHDPGKLLFLINAEICETGTRGMFVTIVGGIYDPQTDTVRFANAGHEPPLYRTESGAYHAFPAEVPPLGIATDVVPESGFPVTELALKGGTFTVFTDGITEGRREDGGMLGVKGLKSLMEAYRSLAPIERITKIADSLDRPGAILHDDLTLLTIEKSAPDTRG
ncbi:MAG: GAF domain-containing SpoIIE family protein phosphatase [Gammaproteobacteria bacterium]|nr:GAF domain-containing SpoIIE family protein phosphatase [Gammaproteobacteria bacterium]